MKYAYYPGCSLLESAQEFDVSVRAVMNALGVELEEIPDWTCCGASAAEPVSRLMNYALPARNLAIAEEKLSGLDVLAPCSACYLNLLKVNREVFGNRELHDEVNKVLGVSGLAYTGSVRVRHLCDVLLNDIGPDNIAAAVVDGLEGMRVAPYYGCQILRPYSVFDDPRKPKSMEPVLKALGAEVFEWDSGNRCCGASLMMGHRDVALHSVGSILSAAAEADVIVTVCPLCQMNLEAYQDQLAGAGVKHVPVIYLSQLMGMAFGFGEEGTQLNKNLTVTAGVRKDFADKVWAQETVSEHGGDVTDVEP
ncbi:CoB--CoM heterodisulfide reductase iron-sulfur subunit B family protein [Maridesulfovibrio sp.]|uniref:CoB--CoM heterodisulfide reductase iron-sulfur subunit B family protein n=1 Tax=Maridesulfovibrio sp. TaxID=2795000 RepID=UPI0039F0894C